jgi:DNA-binding winged helix-turn-helix (wHTH) protein/tetratricopeptide (TPR) repeat protein
LVSSPAQAARSSLLAFDGFVLDLNRGVLTAKAREVVLRPKTTAVLAHLLAHAGQVVSREALMTAVWGDIAVTDDSLTQCVSEIRRALGADASRVLQTHARRGYMMATQLRPVTPPPEPAPTPSPAIPPPRRSRMGWAALLIGCAAAALSAAAWMRAEPPPAPAVSAPAPSSSWDRAWVLVEEGRAAQQGDGSFETRLRTSLPFFLRALAIEPRLAEAAAQAALVHLNLRINGFSQDPPQDLREAQRLASLAMDANPEAALSLSARATVLWQQRRFAEALPLFERAGQHPDRAADTANAGIMRLLLGAPDAALPPLRAALLEVPQSRFAGSWRSYLALAQLLAGEPDQAADGFLTSAGRFFPPEDRLLYRLAALLGAGRLAEAEAVQTEIRQRNPAPRTAPLAALELSEEPRYRALFETAVLAPLRRLGWFEASR